MPGLDEYYRYLDKQDKTRKPEAPAKNGVGKNGKAKKARLPEGPLPGSVQPGVRYVLKGGVTVAVPVAPGEEILPGDDLVTQPSLLEETEELTDTQVYVDDISGAPLSLDDKDLRNGVGETHDVSVPDYLPQLVEAAEPTEVAEASTRPRRPRSPEPGEEISDGDAAALWKRLPRHIQLLVGMTPESKEEPAQKYYSRGFKESRQQLIDLLLDPTMNLVDTARVLGVCPTTVRRYNNRGVL
ncbi:MAG: hypothetical protein H7145_22225, partial [Akkermansiaceae bacterium]|nr:hypothetical protein [Armatimonadota bacterium]